MNIAWYYYDMQSMNCYYTESYSMSVTSFAEKVSAIVGYTVKASDTSAAHRWSELDKFNAIHI